MNINRDNYYCTLVSLNSHKYQKAVIRHLESVLQEMFPNVAVELELHVCGIHLGGNHVSIRDVSVDIKIGNFSAQFLEYESFIPYICNILYNTNWGERGVRKFIRVVASYAELQKEIELKNAIRAVYGEGVDSLLHLFESFT